MRAMESGRGAPAVLLALLYVISGVFCCAGAAWPMNPGAPVGLLWLLAAVGIGGGAALALWPHPLPERVLHAAIGLMSVLVAVLAWRSSTPVGVVALGPAITALALYSAHFLRLPAARAQAAFLVCVTSLGALAAEPTGFLVPWLALVGTVVTLTEAQGRLAGQLRAAAGTDPLTGVANRRAWEAEAARHLSRSQRTGEPLCIALLDLDDFKRVNDRDGHGAGDALLRELTSGWRQRLRHADLLGRYGGDEFVLCLPATDETGAWELLGRLQDCHPFGWTVGLAVAGADDSLTEVLSRADAHLYARKRSSRRA
jgi:GGDEF domain-containing protein